MTINGGYLFAVKNTYDTVIQFGLQLESIDINNRQNLKLFYTEDIRYARSSNTIATFNIPAISNKWTKLALKVEENSVKLFINCELFQEAIIQRTNSQLGFQNGAPLFVAQAGPNFEGNQFVVSIKFDKIKI